MAELTDPSKPAADRTNIVTPGFSSAETGDDDDHLNQTNADGLPPYRRRFRSVRLHRGDAQVQAHFA
jgi:hypothetical protein